MQITTKYNRIDRVIYQFNEEDIHNALAAYAKIRRYEPGKRMNFEIDTGDEDNNYKLTATITVIWESPQQEQETTDED
jgi:hypothetical protein